MSSTWNSLLASLRHRFRQAMPLDWAGFSLAAGLRAATAVALPVLLAEATDHPTWSWVAIIAFWGCLCDTGGAWRERLAAMASFTVLATLAVILALLAAPILPVAVALVFAWSFLGGMARIYGNGPSTVGLMLTSDLLVSLGIPGGAAGDIIDRATLTVAGGLWAMLLVLVVWRLYPYGPARRAVSRCWREVALYADALGRLPETGGWERWALIIHDRRRATRDAIEAARDILANERRRRAGESTRGELILVLLEEADRLFEAMIAANELIELGRRDMKPELQRALGVALRRLAQRIFAVGVALVDRKELPPPRSARAIDALLRRRLSDPAHASVTRLVDRVAGYVEAAGEIVVGVRAPRSLVEAIADRPPGKLIDIQAAITTFRANLDPGSIALRHALRLALTASLAQWITVAWALPRGYWLTLTVVVVLQPFLAATWRRGIERVAGSVSGGLVAAAAGLVLHRPIEIVLIVFPLSVASMAVRGVNYTLFVFFLTPQFVLIAELFQTGGIADWNLAGLRALDSAIGGALGLVAGFALWPSREGPHLPRHLAEAIRRNRAYLAASLEPAPEPALQEARRRAGLASNNAEASLQRLTGEPRRGEARAAEPGMTIVTGARRLAGAAAAIAHLRRELGVRPAPPTQVIGDWVSGALDRLADALEQGESPPALPPSPELPPPEEGRRPGILERELARSIRQVEVIQAAAIRMGRP